MASHSLLGLSLVSSPTELSTSFTDLVLAGQSILALVLIARMARPATFYSRIWCAAFSLLAASTLLGAAAHGLVLSPSMFQLLWILIYLVLALLMAAFVLAAASYSLHPNTAPRLIVPAGIVALLFFTLTQLGSGSFLFFVLYEAVALVVSLGLYLVGVFRRTPGSSLLACGVGISIVAATLDAIPSLSLQIGPWSFDRHGIFHLVQMPSLILLTFGIVRSLSYIQHRSTSAVALSHGPSNFSEGGSSDRQLELANENSMHG